MKNKKMLALAAAVVLLLTVGGTVFAQTAPAGLVSSPTRTSTATRFRTAADDFIRPGDYTSVKFDKFFAFASWASANKAVLGYAGQFGGLYLGAYYGGTLWGGVRGFGTTKQDLTFNTGYKEFSYYASAAAPSFNVGLTGTTPFPDNRIALLFGVADMGFRVSFASTHQAFKQDDFAYGATAATATQYKSYQTDYGVIAPQLAWSMAKDLVDGKGIRPYATLDLNFWRNYTKYESYSVTGTTSGEQIGTSDNSFRPNLNLGLGGYTFYNQNGFKAGFDIEYTLGLRLYSNDYSYQDTSLKYQISKINGSNNGGLAETSYVANTLMPSLSGSWSQDKVALKAKLNLNVYLNSEKHTAMGIKAGGSGDLEKNGLDRTDTYFGFGPQLQLALQYKLVPNKLTVNLGSYIANNGIGVTTRKGSTYAAGTETPHTSITTTTPSIGATSADFRVGASYNFTDNVVLDVSTGVTDGNGNALFGNVTTFSSILVSLKF